MPVDVYVQDPYLAESNEGLALSRILVECEPELMAGPTSARIAVVDYDADTNKLEDPVQWDRKNRRFFFQRNGEKVPVTRAHRDLPQFHQVNVWAIIQSVLGMFEATWVLGRSAPWAFDGIRLLVVPHAGHQANAYKEPLHSKASTILERGQTDEWRTTLCHWSCYSGVRSLGRTGRRIAG